MTQKSKITIKQILTSNQNWLHFYEKYKATLRASILTCIVKLLSCKNVVRGYNEYHCSNTACSHIKRVPHTCKCKACSSCGKKATEMWIQQQNQILPLTPWQHITFTMPSELWDFFWYNRSLLNQIGKLAANCIQSIANKKRVTPSIFIAIHTFGRDLKRNVHIHLSTTLGGLSLNHTQWKNLFFHQTSLTKTWRYNIITLFRKMASELILPPALQKQLNHTFTFNHFLDKLYRKKWIVHCSKPSDNPMQNVSYLGRYFKRPAIAESKLRHYDGNEVTFKYLDHNTKTYRSFKLTAEQFIARFVQHIPDIGFRMIRYYGFLAHRVRGKLLPLVHQLLGRNNNVISTPTSYAELIQQNFGFNPLICILCGQPLILRTVHFGKSAIADLLSLHHELASLKIC
jgi:Putative transposase/Transposase zinc-binding domain